MKSLWDDQEAAGAAGDRAYASRLLGRERSLVMPGGASGSVKVVEKNVFGEEEELLFVNGADRDLESITADDWTALRLQHLLRLAALDSLSDTQLAQQIRSSMVDPCAAAVSPYVLLHAVLPFRYVDHAQPDAVLAIANTPGGWQRFQEIYGQSVVLLPYRRSGLALAKMCATALSSGIGERTIGLVLMQNGVVSFGETAQASYERMVDLISRAEQYLADRGARPVSMPAVAAPEPPKRHELAALRQAVSASAGVPFIVSTQPDPQSLSFARRDDAYKISQRGPVAPRHVLHTKPLPLLGRDVDAFGAAYERYFAAQALRTGRTLTMRDPAPRVVLDRKWGMCAIGRTAQEAALVGDLYRHTMEVILAATALDEYRSLLAQDLFEVEYAEMEQARLGTPARSPMFTGEIALVTGAASGIGRACAAAFLARGAAVVGLDINPSIAQTFEGPGFLGLQCDVTDEDALVQAMERTVRAFGGLDMLVPNAGIFPPGCRIASLASSEWDKVMRLNLDANLVLMREAHPLLKAAPRGGRVVVVGSRNVPAPGPGAVAYSASKAALTQIARVAALEWGAEGIRVNIVNPHAVFDTGIWTDEVLQARADYYGLTVEQYKKNNVLRVEITSHDVAELVAEMCGPLFAKTTGAQVPIDGGSNRVI